MPDSSSAVDAGAVLHIEHLAIYVRDLDAMRLWYGHWFGAQASARYDSRNQPGLSTIFLTFPGGGARIELMTHPSMSPRADGPRVAGYAHFAMRVGSRDAVHALVARMRDASVIVRGAPRETGDGYYEAVVEDPDGNLVEIMA
jgi:lactoylglutathione lyase